MSGSQRPAPSAHPRTDGTGGTIRRHDGVGETHYDLAVIGTGSGNTIVDERFADRRVAILEESTFGGTCLNVGCIPTKMFVYPADLARDAPSTGPARRGHLASTEPAGRRSATASSAASTRSRQAARTTAPRSRNVDVYEEHARFVDDHTLDTGTGRDRSPPTRS